MTETPPVDYIALAQQAAEEGPVPSPPSTLYFTYLRTDGDSFVGPATNSIVYLRKGYTITGEQTIESMAAWNEEQSAPKKASRRTPEPAPSPSPKPAPSPTPRA